jgi:hypothetical protein
VTFKDLQKQVQSQTSLEQNQLTTLRAAFLTTEIECYIQKPVAIKDLVRRITAELVQ